MNNDMKCPFCQQELKIAGEHTTIMSCFNGDCKGSGLYGEKEFWQELIRIRKALDILLLTINRLEKQNYKDCAWHLRLAIAKIKATDIANKALEQITALEQKDVK